MTKGQINEFLANTISVYAPTFGRAITKKTAQNLAMSAISCQIEYAAGDAYAISKTALSECGTIIEENMEDAIITGVIMSGSANMNPAFLLLCIEGSNINLTVCAKEGLIKQHTAEHAIDVFKSALSNADV